MRAIGNQEMTASPRVINRHNYVIEERSAVALKREQMSLPLPPEMLSCLNLLQWGQRPYRGTQTLFSFSCK